MKNYTNLSKTTIFGYGAINLVSALYNTLRNFLLSTFLNNLSIMNTNLIFSTAVTVNFSGAVVSYVQNDMTIINGRLECNEPNLCVPVGDIVSIHSVQKIDEFWFKKSDVEEITFIKANYDKYRDIFYYVGTCNDIDGKEHYILKTKFSNDNFVLEIGSKEILFLMFPSLNEY